jgi:hypothetical protein
MTEIEEFLISVNKLCKTLEISSMNEKMFCQDLCIHLEKYTWELHQMKNDIQKLYKEIIND